MARPPPARGKAADLHPARQDLPTRNAADTFASPVKCVPVSFLPFISFSGLPTQ
jgi:hypothetical protein